MLVARPGTENIEPVIGRGGELGGKSASCTVKDQGVSE